MGRDDEHGSYHAVKGELLDGRYRVVGAMGHGAFGAVLACDDEKEGGQVAVKVVRARRPFLAQARTEVAILRLLAVGDPRATQNVVRMKSSFALGGHMCLVFERLSRTIYDLIKSTHYQGVSLEVVRTVGRQLLSALEFLRRDDVQVVHCDLKPENAVRWGWARLRPSGPHLRHVHDAAVSCSRSQTSARSRSSTLARRAPSTVVSTRTSRVGFTERQR